MFLILSLLLKLSLMLSAGLLLGGCLSQEQAEDVLPGLWEGSSKGHSWCVNYGESHALHIKVKVVLPVGVAVQRTVVDTPVMEYYGRWDMEPGPRLFTTVLSDSVVNYSQGSDNVTTDISSPVDAEAVLTPEFDSRAYIIESIDESQMRYRDQIEDGDWYTSKRVERCSSKFTQG